MVLTVKKTVSKIAYILNSIIGEKIKKFIPSPIIKYFRSYSEGLVYEYSRINISVDNNLECGINLIGLVTADVGLGRGCRLLGNALDCTNIPWVAININNVKNISMSDTTYLNKIVSLPKYNVNIVHINPDLLKVSLAYLPAKVWNVKYNIAFFLWELSDIPDSWVPFFSMFNEIWTPSNFTKLALEQKTDKPVTLIPYGICVEGENEFTRESFGLSEEMFLYLVVFDVNSVAMRKNPQSVVAAYKMLFNSFNEEQRKTIGLVIKINHANDEHPEVIKLKESLNGYGNIFFYNYVMSKSEIYSLINCVDCYISLHRSEGFGLVLAEAMYLHKPIIATNWSANVDFINEENSCPVKYKLITLAEDYTPYTKGSIWAEADIEHAVEYMRKLYFDDEYRTKIAQKAGDDIRRLFSPKQSGNYILSRLKNLGLIENLD